jgi:exodeoxyribonuclease V beta subunit
VSVTFIEASAGTGKTYTLVNRVIGALKRGVRADAILLVTFTEKATDELKTRIRLGLRQAYREAPDETLARALEDWTSLTIATIHGFCRTLLTQFPLESGVSFTPELVDQAERSRRLLRDELRPRLTTLGTLAAWSGLEDEEELLALAAKAVHDGVFEKPFLHPDTEESALFDQLRTELEAGTGPVWDAVRGLALPLPADTAGFGDDAALLNATTSKVPLRVARAVGSASSWRELLDVLVGEDVAGALGKWEAAAWKKAAVPPSSGILGQLRTASLALAEVLQSLEDQAGMALGEFLRRCARYRLLAAVVPPVLEKRSDRELTYRDLVERVRTLALNGALDKAARRWKAVLIDEFQDTDRDQWDIFSRLFLHDGCDLTVVGDPKQSIYRFRGADLDVYRAAREQVGAAASFEVLDENYRSTEAMIGAVNELFDPARVPWPRPDDFRPSRKGNKPIASLYRMEGGRRVLVPPVAARNAPAAEDWHRHLVAEVLSLLDGAELDDGVTPAQAVSPADILVLVRRNREAEIVAGLLESKGIPVAVGGTGGLLATREAAEVTLFLKALESPASLSAARALTWTRLLAGADAETLAVALQAAQEDRLRGAFVRAFRRVAAAADGLPDGGGLETLLARPGGARAVTNAEHVLEFVQERFHRGEVPHGQAALSLERWRAERRQEDEIDLRRDGDSPVVRVLTVHAAKGLEAPIVLHGWPDKPRTKDGPWIITGGVDFLLTTEGRAAEAAAEAAETLRLRYVALTRARSYQVIPDEQGAPLPGWSAEAWQDVPRWSPPAARHEPPTLGKPVDGLETRYPWVESHSGLWRRSQGEAETTTAWDRPLPAREAETEAAPTLADQLPAGPAFGDLVHDILETVDWRGWAEGADKALQKAAAETVDEQVQRHRSRLGMPGLGRAVERWLARVLSQPLALGADTVRFIDLAPEQTRRELEFHLPFTHPRQRVFSWGGREFTVHPGYLTGRIDLIFASHGKLYLADWKTNRLTGQTPDEVMAEAGYDLQAQWYWEALTRLCRVQNEPLVPGGILYVFLRGAGDKPAGVFLSPEHLAAQRTLAPFLRGEA